MKKLLFDPHPPKAIIPELPKMENTKIKIEKKDSKKVVSATNQVSNANTLTMGAKATVSLDKVNVTTSN